jgi:hypothetical protein
MCADGTHHADLPRALDDVDAQHPPEPADDRQQRGVLVPADDASTASALRCASGSGNQEGETRVVGVEGIAVGDSRLQAVHVRTVGRVTGGDSGTETTDWWLDERSGLPLRIGLSSRTSRSILIGNVHYREDADLRLRSMTPLR